MSINICIPTLNRYDLLVNLILSIENGTVKPDMYWIVDNGKKLSEYSFGTMINLSNIKIVTPTHNIGTAKSWNYFIKNVPETRVIVNDDIEFYPDTLEILVNESKTFRLVSPTITGTFNNDYSLFTIGDAYVKEVGLFDEELSPNYCYFEDDDYRRRSKLVGLEHTFANCSYKHIASGTLKAYSDIELERHHSKFRLAQANYIRKWGGLPGNETKTRPYGGLTIVGK